MPARSPRLLLPALTLLGSLAPALPAGSTSEPEATVRPIVRPLRCDYIKRLAVDYLDDDLPMPAALNTLSGTMPTAGPARFHLYAATNEVRFRWNVSSERRAIRIRVRRAPGSAPVPGTIRYTEANGFPHWEFRLQRRTPRARKAILDFSYRCTAPVVVYRWQIELDIPGTQPES